MCANVMFVNATYLFTGKLHKDDCEILDGA